MKTILLLSSILFTVHLIAQNQGEIKYTTIKNLHFDLDDNDPKAAMIKQFLPETIETVSVLLFTPTESIYKNIDKEEGTELEDDNEGGVNITIEISSDEDIIYTDIEKGIIVEQRELMGKNFLIKDSLQTKDWHVIEEQKMVSGIMCQKAELFTEEDTITAWYTSEIPISTGPSGFGGLPGLIVSLTLQHGSLEIIATEIIKRKIEKNEIKPPKKGKLITQKAFEKLQNKKQKEQEEQFENQNEDGNSVIIISN